jgi:hypothetical protein
LSEADWAAAKSELTRSIIADRARRPDDLEPRILYGILNVGSYTRFYELEPSATELRDFVGSGNVVYDAARPLELLEDEETIHAVLHDMCNLEGRLDQGDEREE